MPDKKAFIIIDLQKDYLWDKRKSMFTYNTDELVGNVNRAIAFYKEAGYDIIYIKHILPKVMWGVGFSIKGTEGAELYEGLDMVSDLCFEKNRSDSYTSKAFTTMWHAIFPLQIYNIFPTQPNTKTMFLGSYDSTIKRSVERSQG